MSPRAGKTVAMSGNQTVESLADSLDMVIDSGN